VRTKGGIWMAALFLAVGLYGMVQSLLFHEWESVSMPAAVSSVIVIMALIEVVKELRLRFVEGEVVAAPGESGKLPPGALGRLGLMTGWTAGLMLGTYLIGFRIAVPLFAFAYLKWRGKRWITAIVFAGVMLGFIYGAFEFGLKAQLLQGIVFGDG